jgi:hypothetical protein
MKHLEEKRKKENFFNSFHLDSTHGLLLIVQNV